MIRCKCPHACMIEVHDLIYSFGDRVKEDETNLLYIRSVKKHKPKIYIDWLSYMLTLAFHYMKRPTKYDHINIYAIEWRGLCPPGRLPGNYDLWRCCRCCWPRWCCCCCCCCWSTMCSISRIYKAIRHRYQTFLSSFFPLYRHFFLFETILWSTMTDHRFPCSMDGEFKPPQNEPFACIILVIITLPFFSTPSFLSIPCFYPTFTLRWL